MKQMTLKQTKRIAWVDTVKYICIILVMLSHLDCNTELWRTFYSPFFLTAFFFVSGYVYNHKNNFKNFLYKKIRQLFIPWLVLSNFNILLSHIISFNEHDNLLSELKWNFLQIRDSGDELWFIAALFITFIPFYFFIKVYQKSAEKYNIKKVNSAAILIALLLSVLSSVYSKLMPAEIFPWNSTSLPWHTEYMFRAMFYMVLGYLFRQNAEELFDKHNTLKNRIIITVFYFLIVFIPYFTNIEFPFLIQLICNYITALIGITFVIMIAKIIKPCKYTEYIGQNTLICFAFHGKAYSLIQTILKKFAGSIYTQILSNTIISSLFALAFAIVLSVLMIIPAYIINKWFPFIIGRKKSNQNTGS